MYSIQLQFFSMNSVHRYCRQVIDETLRWSVAAPWGARVQMDHDLQIGEYVVPKEVECDIINFSYRSVG